MHVRLFAMLLVVASLAGGPVLAQEMRAVDVARSRATFSVTHAFVQRVNGTLPIVSAAVALPPNGAIPESAEATLDPRRIASGDGDRDEDLQGPDWFDTTRYPFWTFKSTKVVAGANGAFAVDGLLTIHGKSVPVVLDAKVVRGLPKPAYVATTHVDRHAFGMVVTRTDALVGSDVTIRLEVETK